MRTRMVVLLTSMALGALACAEGETLSSPSDAGGFGGGPGGSGAGVGIGGTGNTGGSGGATSGTCGLQTQDPVCDNCINAVCFQSCNACATNDACLDLLSCIQQCNDTTCENACIGQYPTGQPLLDAFAGENGCMTTSCGDECLTTGCGLTTSDTVCDDCMNNFCFAECEACANEPQCLPLRDCLVGCSDTTCEDNCVNTYPAGLDPLMNLLGTDGCVELRCSTQCA